MWRLGWSGSATPALWSCPPRPCARPLPSPARPRAAGRTRGRPAAFPAAPARSRPRPSAGPRAGPDAGSQHRPPAPTSAQTPPNLGKWASFSAKARSGPAEVTPGLAAATDLPAIRAELGDCRRCGLCEARNQLVFGSGAARARLLIIGEAPGAEEDRLGEPFVGAAGAMLDGMLEKVLGLRRDEVYICNVVKCRPPGNRNPQVDEIAACKPFLDAQIRAVAPDRILILGSVACRALLDPGRGIKAMRGQWQELSVPGGSIRVMPTFHPAYLLRQPADKRLTFQDLLALKADLDALPPRD